MSEPIENAMISEKQFKDLQFLRYIIQLPAFISIVRIKRVDELYLTIF